MKKVNKMEHLQQKEIFEIISRQSNDFIESPYAQEYTELELKTMEFTISSITSSDYVYTEKNQIKIIKQSVSELAKMIGSHPDDLYKRANALAEGLLSKKIRFKIKDDNGNDGFVKHNIFTDMAYKNGQFTIGINPFVLPYFIKLSRENPYTEFRLANILKIGSSYGIKLYKLLKQYENTVHKYRDFKIEVLREQFGISNELNESGQYVKYSMYNNFKQKVIKIAVDHINQRTDLIVTFVEYKESRKVTKIRFYIKSKLTQLEQAKILFTEFMNSIPEDHQLKYFWNLEKNNPSRLDKFKAPFKRWIELSCKNYIEVNTELLEANFEDSLFYNKNEIYTELLKIYHKK